jgi:putative NADH-flavin reductase
VKVLIIGATGKIGRLTVSESLGLGHHVTAFGRAVDRIKPVAQLTVFRGDVLNADDVNRSVPGHDVVILTFGAIPNVKTLLFGTDLCDVGTRNVIAAMEQWGVRRLVAMTSIGAGDSAGHGSWAFRNIVKPVLLGRIMKDRTNQETRVRASRVSEWVIVRPSELTDGPQNERLQHFTSFDGEREPSNISRSSVAAFLANVIVDKTYDHGSVLISSI